MKKIIMVVLLVAFATVVFAAEGAGRYTVEVTTKDNGNDRQVIVFDTQTGDFFIYEIDNEGLDRHSDNEVYYPCIKFSHANKTREVIKVPK